MGQINTNNYPTVNSLLDADLLIVENAQNGTGTTTPKQLRENAIGTTPLQTSAQTVTGAINELKTEIDAGAGVVCYEVATITSGFLGQFSGSANLLLLHLTTDGTADATNGYMMMLSYSRPVARFAYGRLVDADGVTYKQDVYADNTIICKISNSGEGTESDPEQVVILGIINASFMLTPTAVISDRDIQDGQGNTLSVLAEALTKTASGNPVVISDCAGGKARSLKTTINAIQDLHGLPFPYVGGAYKNKLPLTVAGIKAINSGRTWTGNSCTHNGVTFSILTDTDGNVTGIKADGTASSFAFLRLASVNTFSGNFILNGGISASAIVYIQNETTSVQIVSSEGGDAPVTLSASADTINCIVGVNPSTVLSNQILYPMVRLSTESDASFAPYSNFCPISGRTAVVLTRSDGDEISEDFTIQLGQTVYGADINWDTGVATVKTALVDLGTLTYTQNGTAQSGKYRYSAPITGIKPNAQAGVTPNIISSQYKAETPNDSYSAVDGITVVNSDIYIYDSTKNTMSVADFKTAMDGVTAEYELATPTTIQLTPTQLELLKGYNRVTIDNGSIELGYIAKIS